MSGKEAFAAHAQLSGVMLAQRVEEAQALLAQGQVKAAHALAQQVLQANTEFAPGYVLMAQIAQTVNNFASAANFLDVALRLEPHNTEILFKRAQLAIQQQDWPVAEAMLTRAHKIAPQHQGFIVVLADLYSMQGQLAKARTFFTKARALGESLMVDEHEGLALLEHKDYAQAESCFARVVAAQPGHSRAKTFLAKAVMLLGDTARARALIAEVIAADPMQHEALFIAAAYAIEDKDKERAIQLLEQANALSPRRGDYEMMLASLYKEQGRFAAAEPLLRGLVEREPKNTLAMTILAYVLKPLGKHAEAIALLERAIAADAEDFSARHMLDALKGTQTAAPPDSYVSSLFDYYAERFDQHLVHALEYQTPRAMAALIAQHVTEGANYSLLDLGCGTGLSGEVLTRYTQYRVGVDLSQGMLDKAQTKHIYDALSCTNIVTYCAETDRSFDLITAMDVLVYIGDLTPLFQAAAPLLTPRGIFALSVENGDDTERYALRESGRYAHAAAYVEETAAQAGLRVLAKQASVLRKEGGANMQGYLYLLIRA